MLSFFRRIINSKAGIVVTFIVLGVIALAFAAGDITGLGGNSTRLSGDAVATVGGTKVAAAELRSRVQTELQGVRQQNPTATMEQLLEQGGLQSTLDRTINGLALERFGQDQGMVVSKRSIDGVIAGIPGLRGPNGQFDPANYQRLLADQKLTDAQVRTDIARDIIAQQLMLPNQGATQVPMKVALPYASLMLEKRTGQIAFVPAKAVDTGAAPTDAELQAFYKRNIARYTIPERRIVRYALVSPEQVKARAVPTEAEVAAAYRQQAPRFAAAEKRTIAQVVVADQAGANALAAKVKSGTPLADAARAAGLEPAVQTSVTKAAYAAASSAAIADAAFAAQRGGVVGPIRGPLGWVVARVDGIEQVAGKTLEQARPELVAELSKQKLQQALSDVHDKLDDALAKNATFDEAVADQKLSGQTTPALLANGGNPDAPTAQTDPGIAPVVAAAFQMTEGDPAQLVPVGQDGGFAVVAIGRVVAAAPRPLAQVRAQVAADVTADRARAAARKLATDILAKVNKGTPLPAAIAGAGRALPPVQPAAATRAQLAQQQGQVPPALALMFSMTKGNAKLLEAPNNAGWLIVKLDTIVPGNAAGTPAAVAGARGSIARVVGREYAEQFARAVRNTVGVKTDAAALARVRADLTGTGN
ncbi:SurA N-terminal domain-containing protein [Sphingomonas sp. RP10(2022)]|uniref:Parvulin-like PPIase n=1 Tax=Sphingomonas liriopis TaxID=2949094 RepID=A0A9X2HLC7_9SPHN|nr:peptidylprolyl isomerase [Sphingomonas liriopis]MCP3733336.1 SurA N-terminal domain-containing protein [Sphingomonas liriopis]